MPLDPQARRFAEMTAGMPGIETLPIETYRANLGSALPPLTGEPAPVADVQDTTIAAPHRHVPVRVYRTRLDQDQPVIAYFHGGGWVAGSVDLFDATTRAIAHHTDAAVVSVDYRLAPEHPFPAAIEDTLGVARALLRGEVPGTDPSRVAVAGSSAGGNLAAVAAQQLRGESGLRHQVLIYPATRGWVPDTGSFADYADGYFLTSDTMRFYYRTYAPGVPRDDPRLAPLASPDLSGLAPATIITAEYDPLRDDGEDYAMALQVAGVPVTMRRYEGQMHPFVYLGGFFDQALHARQLIGERLRGALHPQ